MDIPVLHRLALNESPYPPLPSVREAMHRAVAQAHRYPPFHPDELTERIAAWCRVTSDRVVVGNGSVGVALQLLQAVVHPGDTVAYGWRTFDAYPLLATMVGAHPLPVPLSPDGHQDLGALLAALDRRTGVVVLCNPHNPTGSLITADALSAFLRQVPRHISVLLDEAYVEFARHTALPDAPALLDTFPNLLVLRTFSKAYGLAALRVGYGLGAPDLVARIRGQQLPFGINAVATEAVKASLRAGSELRRRVDTVVAERERLRHALAGLGWRVRPSHANSLWLPAPDPVDEGATALTAAGVQVRHYPGEGLRITIGPREANDAVVAALAGVGHPEASGRHAPNAPADWGGRHVSPRSAAAST
ncbi:aminotransferase class I/II-fold pyridoxal phosphate-dependent enzyme [Streptomyces luteolifulvus]|uniref:Aminotransferase class I/II-fold pyridoxal phosphate-dependent enzyme n=1 Tax=Streptomyces luteolifulvus TaxID=2615112 RepID=A0A6H9UPV2_9ACTN|nr:histidinol-phosphate transaminase [Streptomyces luteolifulvus]KAB1140045.1 aminotransferase class I/II-fold pyridoxal phosphate-dependent enzyme [Streptomyces luteolifulvus]